MRIPTYTNRILVCATLFLVGVTAGVLSFYGWWGGQVLQVPRGVYYSGYQTIGLTGFIFTLIFFVMFLAFTITEIANKTFFVKRMNFYFFALFFLTIFLVVALILGAVSFFLVGHFHISLVAQ